MGRTTVQEHVSNGAGRVEAVRGSGFDHDQNTVWFELFKGHGRCRQARRHVGEVRGGVHQEGQIEGSFPRKRRRRRRRRRIVQGRRQAGAEGDSGGRRRHSGGVIRSASLLVAPRHFLDEFLGAFPHGLGGIDPVDPLDSGGSVVVVASKQIDRGRRGTPASDSEIENASGLPVSGIHETTAWIAVDFTVDFTVAIAVAIAVDFTVAVAVDFTDNALVATAGCGWRRDHPPSQQALAFGKNSFGNRVIRCQPMLERGESLVVSVINGIDG
mmetsp:Transcript_24840/g.68457  ORF Transcript_24840/g.68457 Transcript_24840/m.68457 type:complete len:270 (-) Transcript_24840:469-1278(-)